MTIDSIILLKVNDPYTDLEFSKARFDVNRVHQLSSASEVDILDS